MAGEAGAGRESARAERPAQFLEFGSQRGDVAFEALDALGEFAARRCPRLLRGRGGEAWYLAAKDEGHGFKKKSNRDAYLETTALFLERLSKK